MAEIVDLVVSWGLTTAAVFALLAWDERRLSEAQRARAWPVATRRVAAVVFGALCLPIHFARTRRRRALGLLLGLAWMVAVTAAVGVVSGGIAWALGLEG